MASLLRSILLPVMLLRIADAADVPALPVAPLERSTPVDFHTEIVPFLRKNCFACHNETKAKGNLNLETPEHILKGGDTGPAVEPGHSETSLLFTLATHREEPIMPPEGNSSKAVNLHPMELALLKLWIDQGAKGTGRAILAAPTNWKRSVREPIYTVAVSPDGRFAACGRGHHVHVYDLPRKLLMAELVDGDAGGTTHRDFVHALAFSPDGTLATGGYREVKLWRRPAVEPITEVGSPGPFTAMAESADGQWRATGQSDGSIQVFDLGKASSAPRIVRDHTGEIAALRFLPDGITLISGGADKTLRRRSIAEPSKSDVIEVASEVTSLAWIDAGARIAFGTRDNKIRMVAVNAFDLVTAEPRPVDMEELPGGSAPSTILRRVRLGEQELLLSAGADGAVRIWSVAAKNLSRQIAIGGPVLSLDVSPDGSLLVVGRSGSGPARLFKLADGGLVKDLELEPVLTAEIASLQLQEQVTGRLMTIHKAEIPKLEELLKKESENSEKTAKELPGLEQALAAKQTEFEKKRTERDAAEAALTQRLPDDPKLGDFQKAAGTAKAGFETAGDQLESAKRALAAAASGRELAKKRIEDITRNVAATRTQLTDQEAKGVALKARREEMRAKLANEVPKLAIAGVAFLPDGTRVATAVKDGTVRVYSAVDGAYLESFSTRPGIAALEVDSSGDLRTRCEDGRSITWSSNRPWSLSAMIGDGRDAAVFPDRVTALAFRADGTLLATGSGVPSRGGELKLWNPATLKLSAGNTNAHGDTVNDIEFSPDGAGVVTGSADKLVRTFDAATGTLIRSFESHTGHILGVAWSHDGRRIASVAADQELKLWDPVTGDQVKTLKGWEREITGVAFYSPASEQVVTTCGDKKLRMDNGVIATTESFQHAIALTPDSKYLIAGGEDGILRVWNAARQLVLSFASPHAESGTGATTVMAR